MNPILGALSLIGLLAARHPIHSSSTTVTIPADGVRVTVVLRVFADDFPPGRLRAPVERYLAERFRLLDRRGGTVPMTLDDISVDGAVLVLTLSARAPDGLSGAKVWQGILAERFSDQVNLVRVEHGGRSATLLFIAGDGAKALP
ncbi:MAG TPA: DUF6702 family protein [Gemmatimonadales bacterium]|nr:DUF6702 family protein [Gemmatimonadales bacterium]